MVSDGGLLPNRDKFVLCVDYRASYVISSRNREGDGILFHGTGAIGYTGRTRPVAEWINVARIYRKL